uniref:Predicted protein n=1 Tax=Hordeum vulgare subsp. vulgare TaxID=112509 RepID=F2EH35_HORVV|nr:predicted protein [Hordeum vulgare subsp. vulgare]
MALVHLLHPPKPGVMSGDGGSGGPRAPWRGGRCREIHEGPPPQAPRARGGEAGKYSPTMVGRSSSSSTTRCKAARRATRRTSRRRRSTSRSGGAFSPIATTTTTPARTHVSSAVACRGRIGPTCTMADE